MNEISSASMLAKIREMNAQIEGGPVAAKESAGVDFGALLNQSLAKVNELQTTGAAKAADFEAGAPDADLTQVMVSLQKASLSFQAMTEVRNKLVNAYQEVMNMPV